MQHAQLSGENELIVAIQQAIEAAHDDGMDEIARNLTEILSGVQDGARMQARSGRDFSQAAD